MTEEIKNTKKWAIELLNGGGGQVRDRTDGLGMYIKSKSGRENWSEFRISGEGCVVSNKIQAITELLTAANIQSHEYGIENCTATSCDFQISQDALSAIRQLNEQNVEKQGFKR